MGERTLASATRPLWVAGPNEQKLYAVVRDFSVPKQSEAAPERHLVIMTAVDGAEIREDTGKFASDLRFSLAGLALLLLAGGALYQSDDGARFMLRVPPIDALAHRPSTLASAPIAIHAGRVFAASPSTGELFVADEAR